MRTLALATLALAFVTNPAAAQSLKPGEVLSSLVVSALSDPHPVAGTDGKTHLAYELAVTNPSSLFMTLDKIELVDEGGRSLKTYEGDGLAAMTQLFGGTGLTLSPGGSGYVLLDVTFADGAALPATLTARISTTRQSAGADGKPAPFPTSAPVPASITFTGPTVSPGAPAVVVAPPLRGDGWVAANGCCVPPSPHRAAVISINGMPGVPERFAIDWVKLDDKGVLFTGAADKLENYAYFGDPIHAVADGTVVNVLDGLAEQVAGSSAKGLTPESIGGNMIVVDIGEGRFAFYAHIKTGTVAVKLGDKVKSGDVIGHLGNTGNTDAPHLHFHVMDGPTPLHANGLPFVFTRFSSSGVLKPGALDLMMAGKPVSIDASQRAGIFENRMPLLDEVVDFGD